MVIVNKWFNWLQILGHALAPCISSLETIFSPTLEIIGDHNELDVPSIEGMSGVL